MMALAGCELGSKSLGEDPIEGSSSDTSGGTGDDPIPTGELLSLSLHEGVGAVDMAPMPDGTLVVLGTQGFMPEPPFGGTWSDAWIGGFTVDGTLLWEVAEPLGEAEYPQAIAVDGDGNIYTLHQDYSVDQGEQNRVVRRDATGVPLWEAVVEARPADLAVSAAGVLVVGVRIDGNGSLAWAQALDTDGASVFERTWDNDIDEARSLFYGAARQGDQWVIGGGRGVERWSSASRAWLVAIDDSGEPVWDRLLTDPLSTEAVFAIASTATEVVAIANLGADTFIERVGSDGAQRSHTNVEGIGVPRSIAASGDSVALANGRALDDPGECLEESGPCSSGVRTMRIDAMATRWVHDTTDCLYATSPVILDNDETVVLGSCGAEGTTMGLLRYAP